MIDSFHSSRNSSLFQIEIISLWIWQQIFLPLALISSTGIWSIPGDLWFYSFSIANSNSKALGSGTIGPTVCIYACLTSLTSCTFNSWEKYFLHLAIILWESAKKSPFSSITIVVLGRYPFLKSLMSLYKSLTLLILLSVSNSSILTFKYAFICSQNVCLHQVLHCSNYLHCFGLDPVPTAF